MAATLALAGCTTAQMPVSTTIAAPAQTVPPGMQYLYGSGEGAAISAQAWRALVNYVGWQANDKSGESAVLAPDATLAVPRWMSCGTKPRAAVFDVDETVLLNLGFEYNDAVHPAPYDEARWQAWERTGLTQVAAVPGAVEALNDLRKMGVTVVFNTNRSVGNAAQTAAAIIGAGLGPAVHGETLFLAGDDATGNKKDSRRAMIAAKYCVVAMGGDQLGDFSDLFNAGLPPAARRAAVTTGAISAKWGVGWFVLPNPVYGSALKGGVDDIFPQDKRWTPPAAPEAK